AEFEITFRCDNWSYLFLTVVGYCMDIVLYFRPFRKRRNNSRPYLLNTIDESHDYRNVTVFTFSAIIHLSMIDTTAVFDDRIYRITQRFIMRISQPLMSNPQWFTDTNSFGDAVQGAK